MDGIGPVIVVATLTVAIAVSLVALVTIMAIGYLLSKYLGD